MDSFENRVLEEQLKLVYRQLPGIITLPGITALLLCIIFWGHLPSEDILAWFAIALIFTGGTGILLLLLYSKIGYDNYPIERWSMWFNVLSIMSGFGWSSSVYFLYHPDNFVLQLILMLFLYFAMALVAISMTAYRPAFVLLAAPIIIAVTVRLILDFDRLHSMLAITTLFYGITLYIFYLTAHVDFMNYIRVGLEKDDLATALKRRTKDAENENLAKSRFLAAASHDLRQPIVAQELLINALRGHLGENQYSDIFRNLNDNVEALHALFNELVEVSRIDTGNVSVDIDYTDLEEVFTELENQFTPMAQEKSLKLHFDDNGEGVLSDIHLLKRILVNLVSNAIKYTQQGEVNILQKVVGDKIHVIVEDTGIGIPEEEQESIFHEFFRSRNSSASDGFGLGLAIVKRLTHLLDHELILESQPGKGTRVTLIMPYIPDTVM